MDIEARVDFNHPVFQAPANADATIWRYVDFTRLVSLLDTARLFFARTDTLDDPFEGATSQFNVVTRPDIYKGVYDQIQWEALARYRQAERRYTFVNCWNLSEWESAALWGLYVPAGGGVAIKSSFQRLTECFGPLCPQPTDGDGVQRIYIGRVQYLDYAREWLPEGNGFYPYVHKRRSFQFENEVRALIQQGVAREYYEGTGDPSKQLDDYLDDSPPYLGLSPKIDLVRLMEAVHVSPTAPGWFFELTRSVVQKYGLDPNLVVQSEMADGPMY